MTRAVGMESIAAWALLSCWLSSSSLNGQDALLNCLRQTAASSVPASPSIQLLAFPYGPQRQVIPRDGLRLESCIVPHIASATAARTLGNKVQSTLGENIRKFNIVSLGGRYQPNLLVLSRGGDVTFLPIGLLVAPQVKHYRLQAGETVGYDFYPDGIDLGTDKQSRARFTTFFDGERVAEGENATRPRIGFMPNNLVLAEKDLAKRRSSDSSSFRSLWKEQSPGTEGSAYTTADAQRNDRLIPVFVVHRQVAGFHARYIIPLRLLGAFRYDEVPSAANDALLPKRGHLLRELVVDYTPNDEEAESDYYNPAWDQLFGAARSLSLKDNDVVELTYLDLVPPFRHR